MEPTGDVDLLPPGAPAPGAPGTPAPAARPAEGPKDITCGFCGCLVTSTRGQVLEISEKAEGFRDSGLTEKDLKRKLADANAEIENLKKQLNPAKPGGRSTLV